MTTVQRSDPSVRVIISDFTQLRWDDMSVAIDSALAQPAATGVKVVVDHEPGLRGRVQHDWGQEVTGQEVTAVENACRHGRTEGSVDSLSTEGSYSLQVS